MESLAQLGIMKASPEEGTRLGGHDVQEQMA